MRPFLPALAIASLLAGCSDGGGGSGELLDGDVAGTYGGGGFDPVYGVAFTRPDGMLEIQFGEAAIGCDRHLMGGAGNPLGLYVRLIFVDAVVVGTYPGVWIEYDSLSSSGTSQSFSTDADVTISAIDATTVSGTVAHTREDSEHGTLSLNGSFAVTRCP